MSEIAAEQLAVEPAQVTLGIIDDYAIHLDSLSLWLARHAPDVRVVTCASSFREYVKSPHFPPRVTLIGELRSETVSLEAKVKACIAAGSQVVLVAGEGAPRSEARDAGAFAVMPRTTSMLEIIASIRGAAEDAEQIAFRDPTIPFERPRLSPSEERALSFYVQGYSTQQVATEMGVKYETAKTFLRRVRQKYAKVDRPAGRRAELVLRATEDGIV